jgi:hypothetical protein
VLAVKRCGGAHTMMSLCRASQRHVCRRNAQPNLADAHMAVIIPTPPTGTTHHLPGTPDPQFIRVGEHRLAKEKPFGALAQIPLKPPT